MLFAVITVVSGFARSAEKRAEVAAYICGHGGVSLGNAVGKNALADADSGRCRAALQPWRRGLPCKNMPAKGVDIFIYGAIALPHQGSKQGARFIR